MKGTKEISTERCIECGNTARSEQGTFAFVVGGALFLEDDENGGPHPRMEACLDFGVHAGNDDRASSSLAVSAIAEQHMGQFELCFCTTSCIRLYFNRFIDDIERKSSLIGR
jgi:hypothetical protein